jgi:hypothetical protein
MPAAMIGDLGLPVENPIPPMNGDVVEISLFLPEWQATRLERAASNQGLTAAQMMRRLLGRFLDDV